MPLIITDNELKDIREGKVKIEDLYKAHEAKSNGNDKYMVKMLESQVSLFGQVSKAHTDIMKAIQIRAIAEIAMLLIIIAILLGQITGMV
jgi:hypothetical protein